MHQPSLAILGVFVNLLPTNGAFCLILTGVIIELVLWCTSFINATFARVFHYLPNYMPLQARAGMSQKGPFLRHPADSLIVPVPEASHVVSKLILESKY
jgi:hypothetical protein